MDSSSSKDTLISHLADLRRRFIHALLGIAVVFVALLPFMAEIYAFVAQPLTSQLPGEYSMIAVGVTSPLTTPLMTVFSLALALAMPWILYQLWLFVAPGLYEAELRIGRLILGLSVFLFYLGIAFCYLVVLPLVLQFFLYSAPQGVAVMTDIAQYLAFVLNLSIVFGLVFQTPVVVVALVVFKIVSIQTLINARPYMVLLCFALGMLLTPPDILSQVMVAGPMWLLYESALASVRLLHRQS